MRGCVSGRGCDPRDTLLPQQTSEPSHPDIILIAINRHGVLLIHPKTKVAEGPGRTGGAPCRGAGCPSSYTSALGSRGSGAAVQPQGPSDLLGLGWL